MKKLISTSIITLTLVSSIFAYQYIPYESENGDIWGMDNDYDGYIETEYVQGYYKSDGSYVRSHFRYDND